MTREQLRDLVCQECGGIMGTHRPGCSNGGH